MSSNFVKIFLIFCRILCVFLFVMVFFFTGKNNGFPFLVFNEYPQESQIWKSETSPNQGTWLGIPWLGLVSLCQIWDFYGYSLNTLKYPKMGIRYFFLCFCLLSEFFLLFASFFSVQLCVVVIMDTLYSLYFQQYFVTVTLFWVPKQTFCSFSQLPLSNSLFTLLFSYVVCCVEVDVDRITI